MIANSLYFGGNVISSGLKKPKYVILSSTNAEYQVLASYGVEVLWLKNLLNELHVHCFSSSKIFYDNIGATYPLVNPVFHSQMKHIVIDYHFVRDYAGGLSTVSHISTKDLLTNALTKPLSSLPFRLSRSKISVSSESTILRGLLENLPDHLHHQTQSTHIQQNDLL